MNAKGGFGLNAQKWVGSDLWTPEVSQGARMHARHRFHDEGRRNIAHPGLRCRLPTVGPRPAFWQHWNTASPFERRCYRCASHHAGSSPAWKLLSTVKLGAGVKHLAPIWNSVIHNTFMERNRLCKFVGSEMLLTWPFPQRLQMAAAATNRPQTSVLIPPRSLQNYRLPHAFVCWHTHFFNTIFLIEQKIISLYKN